MSKTTDTPQVVIFPPLLYSGPWLIGLLLHLLLPPPFLPHTLGLALGWVLVGGGLVLVITALRVMRRVGTTVDPNRPTTALVRDGPFRFSRNPIYLAFTLLYAGLAALAN